MDNITYYEVSTHPLAIELRKNYLSILNEYKLLSKTYPYNKPNNIMGTLKDQKESNGKMVYSGGIKCVFTRVVPESCSVSEVQVVFGDTEESRIKAKNRMLYRQKLTPVLESILEPYHPYVGSVGFNVMSPGAVLNLHYGVISKYIRFHLGLICDPEAKFIVEGHEPRAWEEGKVWAFDDGDAFHGTVHNGGIDRVILLVDIDKNAFTDLRKEIIWQ